MKQMHIWENTRLPSVSLGEQDNALQYPDTIFFLKMYFEVITHFVRKSREIIIPLKAKKEEWEVAASGCLWQSGRNEQLSQS